MSMATLLHVRGLSQNSEQPAVTAANFSSSVAIAASKRLYASLQETVAEELLPPLIPIVPLQQCFQEIRTALIEGDVTVLASGDPLFYGIGRKLKESFPEQEICFHPGLSSMQLCFARFSLPWDDARFVSFHGRNEPRVASLLLNFPKVFVFTDPTNSPAVLATRLLDECGNRAAQGTRVYVAENLGSAKERLFQGNLAETAAESFSAPNVMILQNSKDTSSVPYAFGLQEARIHHSRGLITKNEVRAAVIHSLCLPDSGVLWDVGAGSGSVGLECARLFPQLLVQAIEKEEEQWQNIEANRLDFQTWNLELIKGDAPEALQPLQVPDRIFVGGSGGNLEEILSYGVEQLRPGGILVVNAVIEKTATAAPRILHRAGLQVEIKTIAVTRRHYPQGELKQLNPIAIIVGKKAVEESER